jgi:hypothetical protein
MGKIHKVKIYIRVANTPRTYKVSAGLRPNPKAITGPDYYRNTPVYPTVQFPVEVEIPEELFDASKQGLVAQIRLNSENTRMNVEIAEKFIESQETPAE